MCGGGTREQSGAAASVQSTAAAAAAAAVDTDARDAVCARRAWDHPVACAGRSRFCIFHASIHSTTTAAVRGRHSGRRRGDALLTPRDSLNAGMVYVGLFPRARRRRQEPEEPVERRQETMVRSGALTGAGPCCEPRRGEIAQRPNRCMCEPSADRAQHPHCAGSSGARAPTKPLTGRWFPEDCRAWRRPLTNDTRCCCLNRKVCVYAF